MCDNRLKWMGSYPENMNVFTFGTEVLETTYCEAGRHRLEK